MQTMTAKELYQREPVMVTNDISTLIGVYYNHIREVVAEDNPISYEHKSLIAPDIEIKIVFEHYFDHRRFWRLATVWYKGMAVMIVQNAGREGDDHAKRFITNKDVFTSMLSYIHTLIVPRFEIDDEDVITLDEERKDLHDFYSNSLDGYFERY